MKIYNKSELKYGESKYNFLNQKFQIFYDLAQKIKIEKNKYNQAFSIMLKDNAQTFYFNKLVGRNLKFDKIIFLIQIYFEIEKQYQKYLIE